MSGAAHIAAGVAALIDARRAAAPGCFTAYCGDIVSHVLLASFHVVGQAEALQPPARATLDFWTCPDHGGALKRGDVVGGAGWPARLARIQALLSGAIVVDAIGLRWVALGSPEAAIVFQNEGGL